MDTNEQPKNQKLVQSDAQVIQPQTPNSQAPQTNPPPADNGSVGANSPIPPGTRPGAKNKKPLIIALSALGVTLLLVLGGVFGYYIPNRPENVWNSGLDRSGTALTSLIENLTEEEKLEQWSSSEIDASIEYQTPGGNFSGNLNLLIDQQNATGSFAMGLDGSDPEAGADGEFSLDFAAENLDDQNLTDIFFRYSGAEMFGLDFFVPGISSFEGQWIHADAEYLRSAWQREGSEPEEYNPITSQESAQLAQVIADTTSEYVFSTDPDKAILENQEFAGDEEVDGLRTYRYKVSFNQDNAEKYCLTLTERVIEEPAYKKLSGLEDEALQSEKQAAADRCQNSAQEAADDVETFDIWIDRDSKLIYKVRFEDSDNSSFVELGQKPNDDNKLVIFANFEGQNQNAGVPESSDSGSGYKAALEMTVDIDRSSVDSTFTLESNSQQLGKSNLNTAFSIKPYDGAVEVQRPSDAVDIEEFLAELDRASQEMFDGFEF